MNTTSEKNVKTLEKIEGAIDKLSGLLESFSIVRGEKKEDTPEPESPTITMPTAIKYVKIRKRGGRVVTRKVQDGVTK